MKCWDWSLKACHLEPSFLEQPCNQIQTEDITAHMGHSSYGRCLLTGTPPEFHGGVASSYPTSDEVYPQGMCQGPCGFWTVFNTPCGYWLALKKLSFQNKFRYFPMSDSNCMIGVASPPSMPRLLLRPLEAFLAYWWMQHFGGLTAKRHLGLSNAVTVGELDLGQLCKKVVKKLSKSTAKSATTYIDKSGKAAFKGSSFLKDTGCKP